MTDYEGFLDITDAKYRAADGLNWSRLKLIGDSPYLYDYRRTHPRPDTASMMLGRAVHAAVLQPDVYAADWKVYDGARRGKGWTQFSRIYQDDYEIITVAEAETVDRIVARVNAHEEAAHLLALEGLNERAIFWEERGRRMKAKIDRTCYAPDGPLFVVDLKTTRDITPDSFGRAADNFGYIGQMEHYATGVEHITGRTVIPLLLVVENAEPFDVGVFHIPVNHREMGARLRTTYLDTLERCEREDTWPGRIPKMIDLPIPRWSKLRTM